MLPLLLENYSAAMYRLNPRNSDSQTETVPKETTDHADVAFLPSLEKFSFVHSLNFSFCAVAVLRYGLALLFYILFLESVASYMTIDQSWFMFDRNKS